MKRTINFLTCGLLMITVIACTYEEMIQPMDSGVNGKIITVKAFVPGDDETLTRVSYTDEGTAQEPNISMEWVDGDKFSVIRGGEYQHFTRIPGTNDFEGTLPDPDGEGKYYAVYPASNSTNETSVSINFSQYQTGELNPDKTYMYAVSEDGKTFKFKHITALLKPAFTGIGDGETVKGVRFTIDEHTNSFIDLTTNTSSSSSNIFYISGLTSLPNYIYLPPMAAGKQLDVVVTTDLKVYSATLTVKKAIEAGKIYTTTIELSEPDRKEWITGLPYITPSGEGTEESPYLIDNAYHLEWMRAHMSVNDCRGAYFKLTSDLSIEGEWTPNNSYVNIDGNGKTISGNMTFKKLNLHPSGFICRNYGTVKNLIMDVDVVGTLNDNNSAYIGSIAGVNESDGVVTGCINRGTITSDVSVSDNVLTGGIAGQNKGRIIGCKNEGEVIGEDLPIATARSGLTGGIVGMLYGGSVVDCVNDGSVKGGEAALSLVGGIVGRAGVTGSDLELVEGCTNNGIVYGSQKEANDNFVGGIIGGNTDRSGFSYPVNVFGCVNNGEVIAGSVSGVHAKGSACGLVGRLEGSVSSVIVACANTGTVTPVADPLKDVTYIVNDLADGNYVGKALWKGGQTYSMDNADDKLYTLVKGSVNGAAITDMNSAISSYNSSAEEEVRCRFVWEWTDGDWPEPVKSDQRK